MRRDIPGVTDHARDRAAERLGRDLTRAEWLGVVAMVVERRALLLASVEDGCDHYLVEVGGLSFIVVWRPASASIATVKLNSMSAGRQAARFREGRVRASLRQPACYRGGKRMAGRTIWQGER